MCMFHSGFLIKLQGRGSSVVERFVMDAVYLKLISANEELLNLLWEKELWVL